MWGCLVDQGAAECCCRLFNKQATNILSCLHEEFLLRLGTFNTYLFALSPLLLDSGIVLTG